MKPTFLAIIVIILAIPVIVLLATTKNPKFSGPANLNATPTPTATSTPPMKAADLVDPADTVSAHQIVLTTDKGDITINLFPEDAPKTVKNFVTLGKRGYYNNAIWHRVIKAFVIQSGDPTGTGQGGESIFGKTFPGEINGHKFVQGTLGMARTSVPDSYGSQFFIVTQGEQTNLDGQYTSFGQIDPASQGVVDAIAGVPVDSSDKPTSDVKITAFRIVK
jgi:cyclophilin family peptidyl-prolyl cis-trans isomerase